MLPSHLQGDPGKIGLVSHWIRRRQIDETPPLVTSQVLTDVLNSKELPSAPQQCELLIEWLAAQSSSPGAFVPAQGPLLSAEIGAVDDQGLVFILDSLKERGLIEWEHMGTGVRLKLALQGWEHRESRSDAQVPAPSTATSGAQSEGRDVFLCHAGEDKTTIVEPLCNALAEAAISYWYDRAEIGWGDSLTEKVNEGLRISRYVLVVLSTPFMAKPWPQRELHAALNLEASSGEVKVLPLLCGDTDERKAILERLPLLNDKLHLEWDGDPSPIISALRSRLESTEAAGVAIPTPGRVAPPPAPLGLDAPDQLVLAEACRLLIEERKTLVAPAELAPNLEGRGLNSTDIVDSIEVLGEYGLVSISGALGMRVRHFRVTPRGLLEDAKARGVDIDEMKREIVSAVVDQELRTSAAISDTLGQPEILVHALLHSFGSADFRVSDHGDGNAPYGRRTEVSYVSARLKRRRV